jgi:3-deoxy-D-glycero-D-galacto-nononate 9-phosphatase
MNKEIFKRQSSGIKLVATDIDGVWTNARMYYSADGDFLKGFSTYDGMAVQLLRENGIPTAILTSENSEIVKRRAEKLKINYVYIGENDKLSRLKYICKRLDISLENVAYIGDDLNDLEVLRNVGISAMPSSSPILSQFTPHLITSRAGGDGAFREFVDTILLNK